MVNTQDLLTLAAGIVVILSALTIAVLACRWLGGEEDERWRL